MTHKGKHREASTRQRRVGEAMRHSLSDVLAREEFRDPDLAGRLITVTEVRVSPDLANATVFVMPFGTGDDHIQEKAVLAGLRRVSPFLRSRIAPTLDLRKLPRLSFQIDESFEEGDRVDMLLRSDRVRKDLAGDSGNEDGDSSDNAAPASFGDSDGDGGDGD